MTHDSPTVDPRLSSAPMTLSRSACLNCDTPFQAGQAFCVRCGQKTATRRMTMGDIGHELIHAFTHADHSVFSLVRALAVRPGEVAREYVDGRRKKYFNPFTFLIIVVGIAALVMASTRFVTFEGIPDNPISPFLARHINLIILGQVPVLALFGKLLFPSANRTFAEHLVLTAYASGFRSIFFTLVVLPAWWLFHAPYQTTVGVYLAAWMVYLGVAYAQFDGTGNRWWRWLKGVLVGVLTHAVTTAVIVGSIVFYFFITGAKPPGTP